MSRAGCWSRRRWLGGTAALALARPALPRESADEAFPSRPIALWVPWTAGGATDISMRLLGDLAAHHLGQRVIVENRGGAGGTLAMPVLKQAEPDGYTIAQLPQPIFRAYFMQQPQWHPIDDVTPIIQISGVTFGLLVSAGSPFNSLDDLFAFARARPGVLSIATNGVGTSPHIVLEDLFTGRGLRYIHVPYKGVSEQINAIASGQVMAGVSSTGFAPGRGVGAPEAAGQPRREAFAPLAAGAHAARPRLRHRGAVALRPGRPARPAGRVWKLCTTASGRRCSSRSSSRRSPSTTRSPTIWGRQRMRRPAGRCSRESARRWSAPRGARSLPAADS